MVTWQLLETGAAKAVKRSEISVVPILKALTHAPRGRGIPRVPRMSRDVAIVVWEIDRICRNTPPDTDILYAITLAAFAKNSPLYERFSSAEELNRHPAFAELRNRAWFLYSNAYDILGKPRW